jgi:hypothetical protein
MIVIVSLTGNAIALLKECSSKRFLLTSVVICRCRERVPLLMKTG